MAESRTKGSTAPTVGFRYLGFSADGLVWRLRSETGRVTRASGWGSRSDWLRGRLRGGRPQALQPKGGAHLLGIDSRGVNRANANQAPVGRCEMNGQVLRPRHRK